MWIDIRHLVAKVFLRPIILITLRHSLMARLNSICILFFYWQFGVARVQVGYQKSFPLWWSTWKSLCRATFEVILLRQRIYFAKLRNFFMDLSKILEPIWEVPFSNHRFKYRWRRRSTIWYKNPILSHITYIIRNLTIRYEKCPSDTILISDI